MEDDLIVTLDEMGTFEGALRYTLALATRWGRLRIPRDRQVMISGFVIEDDAVQTEGVAIAAAREESSNSQIVLADSVISECSVAGVADLLIGVANAAVGDRAGVGRME